MATVKGNNPDGSAGYTLRFVRRVFNLPDGVVAALLRRCAHLSQVAIGAV
jgi:hypothetical protein